MKLSWSWSFRHTDKMLHFSSLFQEHEKHQQGISNQDMNKRLGRKGKRRRGEASFLLSPLLLTRVSLYYMTWLILSPSIIFIFVIIMIGIFLYNLSSPLDSLVWEWLSEWINSTASLISFIFTPIIILVLYCSSSFRCSSLSFFLFIPSVAFDSQFLAHTLGFHERTREEYNSSGRFSSKSIKLW